MRRIIEIIFFGLVFFLFGVVITKYFDFILFFRQNVQTISKNIQNFYNDKSAENCVTGQVRIKLEDGVLCRDVSESSKWLSIYDTYPKHPNGKEIIYSFLDQGSLDEAEEYLQDMHPVERYQPAYIPAPITWTEDPYNDRYWRFMFYSLRSTRHLLYAGEQTRNPEYDIKLREILNSFLDVGMSQEGAWADYHAVSFRTMVLINTWSKLRERNSLPVDLSTKILQALKVHGDFLADRNHFQPKHNHGLNEAVALYLLAINFPDIPGADQWLELSKERLSQGIALLIDNDGVLIENSPYYHFYALEKYWDLYRYSQKFKQPISDVFEQKLKAMISYATYILQPNLEVPLLGASLQRKIGYSGMFAEMADSNPYFKYVLTQGKRGKIPPQKNIFYPDSGEMIMRSGWGSDEDFTNQTQIIFDVGPYRTSHSDLDALSFSLYGNGRSLLPDSGLYTYNANDYRKYFHGTSAHNTVVVDDKDQAIGAPKAGQFIEDGDVVSQSAEHELYDGVQHKRSLTMLGKKYMLIVDKLTSDTSHKYEQMFHLFPGAAISSENLTVHGIGSNTEEQVHIYQLASDDLKLSTIINQSSPLQGVCSEQYEKIVPCYSIGYETYKSNATFITLVEIGVHDENLKTNIVDGNKIEVNTSEKQYLITMQETQSIPKEVSYSGPDQQPSQIDTIDSFDIPDKWGVNTEAATGQVLVANKALTIFSGRNAKDAFATRKVDLDLSQKNLLFRMKVEGIDNVKNIELRLSSNNWRGYAVSRLKNSYRDSYGNEWVMVSLGKGMLRDAGGQWQFHGSGFNWANIDAIQFRISTDPGLGAALSVDKLATYPQQSQESVVFIFDDGYESILPAAEIMKHYGIKGNIAVIGDQANIDTSLPGYLSLAQLKELQDKDGWNMVNHSSHHVDAYSSYFLKNNLSGFENDLLAGAKFLQDNQINSAPNWYIYPHGGTNESIKNIVGKYYAFARSVQNQPEAYPFGDPLGVKTLSASGSNGSEDGLTNLAPEQIEAALQDAKKYGLSLFLTFHRIHSVPSDRPGYDIGDFERVVKFMGTIYFITLKSLYSRPPETRPSYKHLSTLLIGRLAI